MTTCLLSIQCGAKGVAIDQIPLMQSEDPVERAIAGILDLALVTAGEYIAEQARNGLTIEGKNIEPLVRRALAGSDFANLRKIMEDNGYEFPKE